MTGEITLEAAYGRGKRNSIGFLRWFFAASVIFYHGYIIAAYTTNPVARNLHITVGRTAVECFFLLSGFLIARSYASSSGFFDYMWKRILRIYPAFWLSLLVVVFALGPLSYLHNVNTLHGYKGSAPWHYFTGNWTLRLTSYGIPNTFHDTAAGHKIHLGTANGSIWTLWYEFRCYVIVGLIGMATLLWQRRIVVPILTAALGMALLFQSIAAEVDPTNKSVGKALGSLMQPLGDANLSQLLFTFLVGTCFALYADRVTLNDRVGIACVVAVLLIARWHGDFNTLAMVPLGYTILWLGHRLPMSWWDRIGDPSYGVYLYGWPVETLLAEHGLHRVVGIQLYIIASIALSTVLGLLSWHLLEKHALKLKSFDRYLWTLGRYRALLDARRVRAQQADEQAAPTGHVAPEPAYSSAASHGEG